MFELADRGARERFAGALEKNFSVVASAGSGKTRAISDRIVALAQSSEARIRLPQLVVVTYTNRAADEMQQRTRHQILHAGLPFEVREAFDRAFFGTIHRFCLKLLAAYGHHLGLPANLELITDDTEVWNQFIQEQTSIGRSLGEEHRRLFFRHMQARQVMEIARRCDGRLKAIEPANPCTTLNFDDVHAAVAERANAIPNIEKAKAELTRWEERWRGTDEFVPLPVCASGAQDFVRRWNDAFRSLRDWMNACALCVAAEVQQAYRDFRLGRGLVTYADQVALAAELMRQPKVARQIREKNYRVILDEAQDTDPEQFSVLLEIARPPEASGIWSESSGGPPRAGHFCMVGDFQQSIYREPADLARYRELHERLVAASAAEALTFSVTFRLDQAQVDFVNTTFPHILDNQDGQVEFLRLNPRPDVLPGQIVRLDLQSEVDLEEREGRRAAIEAKELARWICEQGLEKLRTDSWQQVAILSPRKAWLRPIRQALLDLGLPVEVQSETDLQAENPAYAWLTALLAIMVEPQAHYEIAGVLREVFGLSDDALARFAEGFGGRFQIESPTRRGGSVADMLNLLAQARQTIKGQPLFSAVQEVVRMTQLRERLRSLPIEEFRELIPELDRLLSIAAAAEARGFSLADLGRELRVNYRTIRESNPSSADAIQLLTAHKAKGLEWQAVIIPFLTRKVCFASPPYPRLLRRSQCDEHRIVFDKADHDQFKDEIELADRQEMKRLLYVALTRAKHSLILVCDRQFFQKNHGKFHSDSMFKWLFADRAEPNEQSISQLPGEAGVCDKTNARQAMTLPLQTSETFGPLESGWPNRARQNARRFVRTLSPSKLSPDGEEPPSAKTQVWLEIEPELRPVRLKNPAIRYGVWWHDLMRRVPWLSAAASWDQRFELEEAISPDRARSARDWRRLRERVRCVGDLWADRKLSRPTVRSEMPFFWKFDSGRSLEGVIDLALFDRDGGECLIIDWKTNQVSRPKIEELKKKYLSQMAAYARVVQELSRQKVTALLYSTWTGAFLTYDPQQLATEWERLKNLPPDDFLQAIS